MGGTPALIPVHLPLAFKHLLNRLIGYGPCAVQPFDRLYPAPHGPAGQVLAAAADGYTFPALAGAIQAFAA